MTVTLACQRWMNNDTVSCLKYQANNSDYIKTGTPSVGRLHRRLYLSYLNVRLQLLHKSTVKKGLASFSMAGGDNNFWAISAHG